MVIADREPEQLSGPAERIVQVAMRLFAERGYAGVTSRELAAAVGLNTATVQYHVGTKRELYARIVRRLYEQERALLAPSLAALDADRAITPARLREVLLPLVEALVDFLNEHPERARLYLRRWLDETDELSRFEAETSLALHAPLRDLLERARRDGAIPEACDVSLFLRSVTWMLFGYFATGPIDWSTWRGDPHDTEALAAFKAYLRAYVVRMLGLPE